MDNECCAKCRYFHRLKHNFQVGKGFEESYCCDVIMHLPKSEGKIDACEPWIQEVTPDSRCEMFEEQGEKTTNRDKLIEVFPYIESIGTVLIVKQTEQVIASNINYNWLCEEYKEQTGENT